MDLARTDQHIRRRKRWVFGGTAAIVLVGIAAAIARIEPAMPTVERGAVWVGTVEHGAMLRQVRGIGSLIPEEITWIAARTKGRVERVVLRPGAKVSADSVILVLSNPDVVQAAADADSELAAAEAEVVNLKAQLESTALAAESAAAKAKSEYEQARLKAETNERLFKNGLVPEIELQLSKVAAEEAQTHSQIERKRSAFARTSIPPQLAVKHAAVERLRAQSKLRHDELEALEARAGMDGVLQSLPVEVGAQVTPGTNLARVANPLRLKAEIRIPETQAKDVALDLPVSIDTRNGIVQGKVSRIDPSAKAGTVTVDVALLGDLPPGARPDLSVDGTIELERLGDVVFVGRPAFGQEKGTISMFKLNADGSHADRIRVQLGRSSISKIEVVSGLHPGDRVILSDMSQWNQAERIRLD